jgi:hypothetical protein
MVLVVHGWSVSLPRVVKKILGGGFAFLDGVMVPAAGSVLQDRR